MSTGPTERVDGRRAKAERTALAILAAAQRVLAEHPDAGMADIAAAAGVGRATLYRHFPAREDLLVALRARAAEELRTVLRAAREVDDNAEAALRRLVVALADLGERYRVLGASDERGRARQLAAITRPLRATVERGQRESLIDPSLSPAWVVSVLLALMRASKTERRGPGRGDAVVDLLLDGVRARS